MHDPIYTYRAGAKESLAQYRSYTNTFKTVVNSSACYFFNHLFIIIQKKKNKKLFYLKKKVILFLALSQKKVDSIFLE